MFTSEMLSMLSTWTSIPTGRAEPGQMLQWISWITSVCTSVRDYQCVNPTSELYAETTLVYTVMIHSTV